MNTTWLLGRLRETMDRLVPYLQVVQNPMTESEFVHACWTALGHEPSRVMASQNVNGLLALVSPKEMPRLLVFLGNWASMLLVAEYDDWSDE